MIFHSIVTPPAPPSPFLAQPLLRRLLHLRHRGRGEPFYHKKEAAKITAGTELLLRLSIFNFTAGTNLLLLSSLRAIVFPSSPLLRREWWPPDHHLRFRPALPVPSIRLHLVSINRWMIISPFDSKIGTTIPKTIHQLLILLTKDTAIKMQDRLKSSLLDAKLHPSIPWQLQPYQLLLPSNNLSATNSLLHQTPFLFSFPHGEGGADDAAGDRDQAGDLRIFGRGLNLDRQDVMVILYLLTLLSIHSALLLSIHSGLLAGNLRLASVVDRSPRRPPPCPYSPFPSWVGMKKRRRKKNRGRRGKKKKKKRKKKEKKKIEEILSSFFIFA